MRKNVRPGVWVGLCLTLVLGMGFLALNRQSASQLVAESSEEIIVPPQKAVATETVEPIPTQVASSEITNNNNVPQGYKRIKFTLVGTGFASQPQTNLNQVNK